MWVLGLMSGTSADGVDAVLARFRGSRRRPRWQVAHTASVPYPDDLRRRIISCGQGQPLAAAEVLGDWVGLRPGRTTIRLEAGRVEAPSGAALPVIHNYGHGGSGLTLGWGCAGDVVQLAEQHEEQLKRMP